MNFHLYPKSSQHTTLPMASLFPGLRRAAPRLARDFFICRHCMKDARPAARLKVPFPASITRISRFNSSLATFSKETGAVGKSPLSALSENLLKKKATTPRSFFPETSSNTVAYWLLGSAASVFGIVIFGGLTRLTESGYEYLFRYFRPKLTRCTDSA